MYVLLVFWQSGEIRIEAILFHFILPWYIRQSNIPIIRNDVMWCLMPLWFKLILFKVVWCDGIYWNALISGETFKDGK